MEIIEKITISNTKSDLWEMILAASRGHYEENLTTDLGKAKLWECYQVELDRVATRAFEAGREYERKKK